MDLWLFTKLFSWNLELSGLINIELFNLFIIFLIFCKFCYFPFVLIVQKQTDSDVSVLLLISRTDFNVHCDLKQDWKSKMIEAISTTYYNFLSNFYL